MYNGLKESLVKELIRVGSYDVKIADPNKGFEYHLSGRHPLELIPNCRSVISFAVARANKLNNTYAGVRRPMPNYDYKRKFSDGEPGPHFLVFRISYLIGMQVVLRAVSFLRDKGYQAIERYIGQMPGSPITQEKLCAYESGLGVYGRSGVILHPELGNRVVLGTVLTDAVLEPDDKIRDFDPCADCDACVRACPAQAFDQAKSYPDSWSREKCQTKRTEIKNRGFYCNLCLEVCPAGKFRDSDLYVLHNDISCFGKI